MRLLAIDTSTLALGVALLTEDRLLGEVLTNQLKNHSVRLMPTLQFLLDSLDLEPQDLDAVAVAQGPGSYTGVRIGVTTAKALSWSLKIPLLGVSTLAVMAAGAAVGNGLVAPLIDARRDRVYTGLFQCKEGMPQEALPERVESLETWLESLPREEPVWFVGDDVPKFQQSITRFLGRTAKFASSVEGIPRPAQLGRLALDRLSLHQQDGCRVQGSDVHLFVPAYLQPTEAERNLAERQGSGSEGGESLGAGGTGEKTGRSLSPDARR